MFLLDPTFKEYYKQIRCDSWITKNKNKNPFINSRKLLKINETGCCHVRFDHLFHFIVDTHALSSLQNVRDLEQF